ncbi:hypothetical protein DFH07DRAFT_729760, partial [Mycena maculata]
EITVNIAIFSPTEMAKLPKKRTASAAGFMKTTDDLAFRIFERKLMSKIINLASLGYTPDDDEIRITFSVPRHVTQPLAIDDPDSYQHMLSNAKKSKDPTVNITVELKLVRRKSCPEKTTARARRKRPSPRYVQSVDETFLPMKYSQIPTENDILPGNKVMNDQIEILRNRWTCHTATCKSDFCWISGEDKTHIALGNPHFRTWAAAIVRRYLILHVSTECSSSFQLNDACDLDTPPNHNLFHSKGNSSLLAPPTLLQRRAAANQPAVAAAPTINITFPDRFADLLQPQPIAPPPPLAANDPGAAHNNVQNEVMLMPPNTQAPGRMTVAEFCDFYDLDNSVRDKLVANGYKNASVFYLIKLSELVAMDFLPGEVAELRDAVRQWAIPK